MSALAHINKLSVNFANKKRILPAVEAVDFQLSSGETLALLGESGCGKTLTSLALMRLLPESVLYGANSQFLFDKNDLFSISESQMRSVRGHKIAMIFQDPMSSLNPVLTIGIQLAEILKQHRVCAPSEIDTRVLRLLKEVDIPEPERRMRQYPHQLSGGQKQRVMIAMALACNPEILIADEPTTALDVTTQAQILALLKKLQKTHHMSLLLITHDLGVVKAMADRVCVMYAGQMIEEAKASAFFSKAHHPYVQQLLASQPTMAKRKNPLSVIEGTVPSIENRPSGCRFHPRCSYAFARCQVEEPQLQSLNGSFVRCHLYPVHQSLPILKQPVLEWSENEQNPETILTVTDLSVTFTVQKRFLWRKPIMERAVDNLSFSLEKGKTLALVGESGCGKTTTSRALLRLLPIDSGSIVYRGMDILSLKGQDLRQYRKKVQIIFQDPFSSMNPRSSVADIIAEGMYAQGMRRDYIQKQLPKLLDKVHLSQTSLNRYPHQFSGGQRQRICIARALACSPEVLICDEPTSSLDVSVQAQILNLLKQLQEDTGVSYLFITHNMAVVSYLADDVLVMQNGKAVEKGDCVSILTHPSAKYTRKLLDAVL